MREAGTRQWRMCKTEAPHRKVVTPLSFFASWKEESRKEVNWRMEADRESDQAKHWIHGWQEKRRRRKVELNNSSHANHWIARHVKERRKI